MAMYSNGSNPRTAEGEQGYILAGVIILLAVFMILMSVAIPKVRAEIRRDQEVETIRRGQQYVRAVQLFYRRFRRYPVSIDELEDTGGIRFLRQRFRDPLTRTDDWVPVFQGQNRAPLSMGYFGQVLNAGAAAPGLSAVQARDSILGAPPPGAPDSFAGNGNAPSPLPSSAPFGVGPIIGVRPPLSMASIIVYETNSTYEEWEFVYDPATDPMIPKFTDGGPYVGAPGVSPGGN